MYGVGEPSAESEPITVGAEEVTGEKEHLTNCGTIDQERISGDQQSEATSENSYIMHSCLI